MSNRVESRRYRRIRSYQSTVAKAPNVGIALRKDGEIHRGEGAQNVPYGPRTRGSARRSLMTLHRHIEREPEVDLSTLKVADLKALAKERGMTGYAKMNKTALIGALA